MAIQKIDFKGLFLKLCTDLKQLNQEDFYAISKEILKDSAHSNLAQFHSDFNIDLGTKAYRYGVALEQIKQLNAGKSVGFNPALSDENVDLSAQFNRKQQELNDQLDKTSKELQDHYDKVQILSKQLNSKRIEEFIIKDSAGNIVAQFGDEHKELFHVQYPELLKVLSTRNVFGNPEILYVWGAPGSGKTHIGKQLAKGLNVPFYPFACEDTVTAGKMCGFNNFASGTFVEGWLYNPFKNGGLVMLDEADLLNANALAGINSMDNDEFTFGNGERVKRHKDFYMLLCGNTIGTGSTKGFTRNVLDAATRDRWTVIELFYDEDLEQRIYGNESWAKYVQRVRKYVKDNMSSSFYVTSRAIRKGSAYLKEGVDPSRVADITIFKGIDADKKKAIIQNVGVFNPNTSTAPKKEKPFKMQAKATPHSTSFDPDKEKEDFLKIVEGNPDNLKIDPSNL